ncbi:hypothetical protein P3H15_28100 [Rhodococcus sp. T2V]|uniref:hypothetical protein n=1 Tax=Rhodococcus sp. T2V TaxID=3034164 RepID=UPI0023E2CC36|nr:hypothetical protein [Rhodococcus sp. T2V]MDF3308883.1 hypothetical protein [Rhodococcus sp. T2V]
MEREYIRDRTLEGHESARQRGKSIGGVAVVDEAMLSMALHLRENSHSLRDIAEAPGDHQGQEEGPAPLIGYGDAVAARPRPQHRTDRRAESRRAPTTAAPAAAPRGADAAEWQRFGARLRVLRREARKTQDDIAAVLSIPCSAARSPSSNAATASSTAANSRGTTASTA